MKLNKHQKRKKRHVKIRSQIQGTALRPRLVVYRSLTGIYAQLIDDKQGLTLAATSSLKLKETGMEAAKKVGAELAKLAKAKKVEKCVFDRAGNLYHGRVRVLAESAREAGLQF